MKKTNFLILLTLAVFILQGCSTIQSRMRERQGAFNALPPEEKKLVQQGVIKTGMNQDAVYIAMGNPSRALAKSVKGVEYSSWIYERLITQSIPAWTYYYGRDCRGRVVAYPYYNPIYTYYDIPYFKVTFKNGKVVEWEQL
ncbi:hypothetical protein QQ054_28925 [Oscillatoria amoena NRMC-F 0135]|nr:hypothetical protein [Oscillatoria amoena NRMC-F 0135]